MPHPKHRLPYAARRVSTFAALLCICACESDDGEVVVLLGGRTAALEVYASEPTPAAPSGPDGVAADTVAAYVALGDSARRLDSTFQREREALNTEVRLMRRENRRGSAYQRRYHAFEERRRAAQALRQRRDSLRARLEALRRRHPSLATISDDDTTPESLVPHTRIPSPGDTVRLKLPAGTWWLLLRDEGPARRLDVTAGGRDTVRLP